MTENYNQNHVRKHIITPMVLKYKPPIHLTNNEKGIESLLEEYAEKLRYFSSDALQKGWRDLTDKKANWIYPTLAEIKIACAPHQQKANFEGGKKLLPWEERTEQCNKAANDYMQIYKLNNSLWDLSINEGWQWKLTGFIQQMAFCQEWCRLKTEGGWSIPNEISLFAPNEYEWNVAANNIFYARQNGHIHVIIPEWLVNIWRAHAKIINAKYNPSNACG